MKILVVRFSSIGDIVLTTPIVRALAKKPFEAEVHFVTKFAFLPVVEHNPYLTKVHSFKKEITEIKEELKEERFDLIIDLHNNLRSWRLRFMLRVQTHRFPKLNIHKWLMVNWKVNILPQKHIVERYFEAVPMAEVSYDGEGLDYFCGKAAISRQIEIANQIGPAYNVFVIGGAHFTKQIPIGLLVEMAKKSPFPVVLLGGKDDVEKAKQVEESIMGKVYNFTGTLQLNESAAIISQCHTVVTADTGLMHIAAAYQRNIHSFWGNTIPEFGMTPFYGNQNALTHILHQVKDLPCRPCSKIGYSQCPKKHFDCMMKQDISEVF
ncbi:MAG: glycosyltransferase family 9 protein [Bacteroidales bacterium]|nr:glycosyltransferase family 9 protein [Bacteroidales bacterium]